MDVLAHRPEFREWTLFVRSYDDTVRAANELAYDSAKNAHLKAFAGYITRGVRRVDVDGPGAIADWVRHNVAYRRESPGTEVLQGPWTTLETKTADCDDLVILWSTLCQSIGLPAHLIGVRQVGQESYAHAMGYCLGRVYELTSDANYGGRKTQPIQDGLPQGVEATGYDPQRETFYRLTGEGNVRHFASPAQRRRRRIAAIGAALTLYAWMRRRN